MAIKKVPALKKKKAAENLEMIVIPPTESELPEFTASDTETGYFKIADLRVVNEETRRYSGEVRFVDKNKRSYNIIFMLEFNRPFTPKYDDKGRYVGGRFLSANVLSHNPVKWVIPYCQRDRLNGEDFGDKIIDFVMVHYKGVLGQLRK